MGFKRQDGLGLRLGDIRESGETGDSRGGYPMETSYHFIPEY